MNIPESIRYEIEAELERADENHGDFPGSIELQVAIVAEEMGEVHKALVDNRLSGKPIEEVYKEMVQVAAMAIKFLMSEGA